jgi:hypothetical protein
MLPHFSTLVGFTKKRLKLHQAHVDVSTTDIYMLPQFLHTYWIHKEEAQPDQVHADVKVKNR